MNIIEACDVFLKSIDLDPIEIDWSLIPRRRREELARYIVNGVKPGRYLMAIVSNDLEDAYQQAIDKKEWKRVRNYMKFLYEFTPCGCWGSADYVDKWIASGGGAHHDP
jgi:hypothetical protein